MHMLSNWTLTLEVDHILRAQGADPSILRSRSPKLIQHAEWALKYGIPLLQPRVVYAEYRVEALRHEKLVLIPSVYSSHENQPIIDIKITEKYISGTLIAQHLAQAQSVIVMLCTIGENIEWESKRILKSSPLDAWALDSLGSAAVEMLANQACNFFEAKAQANGLHTSLPLSPGMIGWTVELGQTQIFSLLNSQEIGITLNESKMMIPQKSISIVLGEGIHITNDGNTCDFCAMSKVCQYKNHYSNHPRIDHG